MEQINFIKLSIFKILTIHIYDVENNKWAPNLAK